MDNESRGTTMFVWGGIFTMVILALSTWIERDAHGLAILMAGLIVVCMIVVRKSL